MREGKRVAERSLVEEFVESFDHHDPKLGDITHDVYQEMRERCPVQWSDKHGGYWIISGYEPAHHALQHYELFSAYPSVSVPAFHLKRPMLPLEVDPPLHQKYRSLLAPVFAPMRILALEDRIRSTATSLIDSFVDRGECEFIEEFAEPLPVSLFTQMMGLPTDEMPRFLGWKNAILHGMHEDPDIPRRASEELEAYIYELLAERKHARRDDIISLLIDSTVEGEQLTDEEIYDTTFLLFLAGLDTVTSSLGLHFLYFAQHSDARDRLVREPELIPDAVEEMMRFESLIIGGRTVTEDIEIYGVQMHKGDRLVVNTVAADRDPAQFPEAESVVLDRKSNRHLGFGAGPHRCVGSHLARIELKVAYEEMHRRIPTYRLAPDAEYHRHADNVHGVDRVPLVWDA
jgi:cytochrome P450